MAASKKKEKDTTWSANALLVDTGEKTSMLEVVGAVAHDPDTPTAPAKASPPEKGEKIRTNFKVRAEVGSVLAVHVIMDGMWDERNPEGRTKWFAPQVKMTGEGVELLTPAQSLGWRAKKLIAAAVKSDVEEARLVCAIIVAAEAAGRVTPGDIAGGAEAIRGFEGALALLGRYQHARAAATAAEKSKAATAAELGGLAAEIGDLAAELFKKGKPDPTAAPAPKPKPATEEEAAEYYLAALEAAKGTTSVSVAALEAAVVTDDPPTIIEAAKAVILTADAAKEEVADAAMEEATGAAKRRTVAEIVAARRGAAKQ